MDLDTESPPILKCDMCNTILDYSHALMCKCKIAIYCTENCQILHYPSHKEDCLKFHTLFQTQNSKNNIQKEEEEEITPRNLPSPLNLNQTLLQQVQNFDENALNDASDRYTLDFANINEHAYGSGVKKVLLKFEFDEPSLLPYQKMTLSWSVQNFDVLPPDGTFMLLERSSFSAENFLSVTFYADLFPIRKTLSGIQISMASAKNINPREYQTLKERQQELKRSADILRKSYGIYIMNFLRNGVKIRNSFRPEVNGVYHFAGHSNSQLRNTSCYLVKASPSEIYQTLHSIGNFDCVKDLAKLCKYIGLLFSTVKSPLMISRAQWEIERDLYSADKKFCLTDGCGRIPTALMREIMVELGLPHSMRTISAIQIRFKGFKGMLVHDPKARKIFFCDSMLKFEDESEKSPLGICNWSRPFLPGYLILHYVLLLSTLGIPDEVFENKQRVYNKQLTEMLEDPYQAYEFIKDRSPYLSAKFRMQGLSNEVITALRALKREEITKFTRNERTGVKYKFRSEIERVRVFVPKSRNVHGVRDTSGSLKKGQVFFCPTMTATETKPLVGRIVVGRTPCYSSGDMRVLECVDPGDGYAHLFDVLVFPVDETMERPHADEMSGGDLDGDLYWCCWDPELIPSKIAKPFNYDGAEEYGPRSDYMEETNERIRFFAMHDPSVLGLIDSVYFQYADRFKADCEECEELNDIFSKVVDNDPISAREKVMELKRHIKSLRIPPSKFIWRRIEEENKKLREKISPTLGIICKANYNDPKKIHFRKKYVHIYCSDFDEPIFAENDLKYKNEFVEGTIVAFNSRWDCYANRFLAYNIVPKPQMDESFLIKTFNIGPCRGIIKSFATDSKGNLFGEIEYEATFMRKVVSNMKLEQVPICRAILNNYSIQYNTELMLEQIEIGLDVIFNLTYDYRGRAIAGNVSLLQAEDLEGKSSEMTEECKQVTDELKTQILDLIKAHKSISNEKFLSEFCLEYTAKLSPKQYGYDDLFHLMEEITEVNVRTDATGNISYCVEEEEKKDSEEELSDDGKDFSISEDNFGSSGEEKEEECYYCKKSGHKPMDCPSKNSKNSFGGEKNSDEGEMEDGYNSDGGRNNNDGIEDRYENGRYGRGNDNGGNRYGNNEDRGNRYDHRDNGGNSCWAFQKGNCRFGDRCRYSHEGGDDGGNEKRYDGGNRYNEEKRYDGSNRYDDNERRNDRHRNKDERGRYSKDESGSKKSHYKAKSPSRSPSSSSSDGYYSENSSEHRRSSRKTKDKKNLKDQIKLLEAQIRIEELTKKLRRRDKEIQKLRKEISRLR